MLSGGKLYGGDILSTDQIFPVPASLVESLVCMVDGLKGPLCIPRGREQGQDSP